MTKMTPGNESEPIEESQVPLERAVHRELLGTQIASVLRRDILLGVLKPGTRLSQQQLCERFGTSRMPVRDGLRALGHEGLVTTDAGQHTIVAPLSRSDFLDSYLIEGTLAGLATSRASQNAAVVDLAELQKLHRTMLTAAANDDDAGMVQYNWIFHRKINRLGASRKILAAIRTTSLDIPRDFLAEMPNWNHRSNAEHEQILLAMKARRHTVAGSLMTDHIVNSGLGLVDYLETQGLQFG